MFKNILLNNGETYAYTVAGQGSQNLLLIHGNMTSSKHWDSVIKKLQNKARIYAVDLRGFGRSSYHQPIHSLQDFSEDLKDFVDQLGLHHFSLIGWSTGGGVAMHLAIDYPEMVEKLILVASVGIKGYWLLRKDETGQPILKDVPQTKAEIAQSIEVAPIVTALQNRDKEFYRTLWNQGIYTKNKPSPEIYEEYLEDMLRQRNFVDVCYALAHFNISQSFNGVTDGSGKVEQIKAPTLVFQGDRDFVIPQNIGEEIAQNIAGAKLVILEDCGHAPMVDSLEALVDNIAAFIGSGEESL
jgi:2-hydroxy-6-oxonona-2,4-dienedioate hydrolase